MAYAHRFLRLVVGGTLYGSEIFTFSMSLINPAQTTPYSDGQDGVDEDVVAAVSSFWEEAAISSGAILTYLKLNEIGTDGKYFSKTQSFREDLQPTVPGTVGMIRYPAQIATAVTLRTPAMRGRAHVGRFYVPLLDVPLDAGGLYTVQQVTDLASTVTTLLNSINTAMDPYRVGVVSPLGAGYENVVTNCAVGRVPDTIRSRRNELTEAAFEGATLSQ
jgi:hypothetical protein